MLLSSNEADEHDSRDLALLRELQPVLYSRIEASLSSVKAAFGFNAKSQGSL